MARAALGGGEGAGAGEVGMVLDVGAGGGSVEDGGGDVVVVRVDDV